MRDGVRLYTEVYLPGSGVYPVVLTRGYWPGNQADALKFVEGGYVYVGQSTRGHGKSEGAEGVRKRFFSDGKDGYDTLDWIAAQNWCDGQIAMYGKSYWGLTQWLAALEGHPNLKAIVPQNMTADLWHQGYWRNGALSLAMSARGRAYGKEDWAAIDKLGWIKYFRQLPLDKLDEVVGGAEDPGSAELWKDYVGHSTFDSYWQAISMRSDGRDGKYEQVRIPVFLMGGWYDYYAGAILKSYQRLREVGATSEIRAVINPADHLNRLVGDRDFGPNAAKDERRLAIRWLNHVLKGIENGIDKEPTVRIFTMGINQWKSVKSWPLENTRFTRFYFRSENGLRMGRLDTLPPGEEAPTSYIYDPDHPVPTLGGNHSFSDTNIPDIIRAGAVDQRPNAGREDVLVFTSEPLDVDTEVTGPIALKLYASSSAPDTDFTAKLIDVAPGGRAFNLTEGILRARFRKSIWKAPELLEPGKIYEFDIELQPTSNVFRAGHRIEVHLTSSNFPLWDRNPNTGKTVGMDTEIRLARQVIFHDSDFPSHIVLPVIKR